MGVYVKVRGFIECDGPQLARLREIVRSPDADQTYGGAWAFPERHYNWTHYAFYGADIRESALEEFLDVLRAIARIPPSDEDEDAVTGLFHVSHEIEGMSEWRIRGGEVHVVPVGDAHRYLDE
jgi:hypothetical protein